MIFVTVGNATQGFGRLLRAVDELAAAGEFGSEEVFAQAGLHSEFQPRNCSWRPVLSPGEFDHIIRCARIVICHAGAGTLLHVFDAGKMPVVMPRRRVYGELVDDHQVELTRVLASAGRVVPAWEPADLRRAIAEAEGRSELPPPSGSSRLVEMVGAAIRELSGEDSPNRRRGLRRLTGSE